MVEGKQHKLSYFRLVCYTGARMNRIKPAQ